MMEPATPLYHLPGFYEPFAAMSHLLGALAFVFLGGILLVRGRAYPPGVPYLLVYSFTVVLQLAASTAFHMLVRGKDAHTDATIVAATVIERLDHAAIFILIAGTYTPTIGLLFEGWQRWVPLVGIWTFALTGAFWKVEYFEHHGDGWSLAFFLIMGWFGVPWFCAIAWRYGFNFVKPLLIGGIAYSIGGLIDLQRTWMLVPGVIHMHELFHIAVLMGAFWHWLFMWQIARGVPVPKWRNLVEFESVSAGTSTELIADRVDSV